MVQPKRQFFVTFYLTFSPQSALNLQDFKLVVFQDSSPSKIPGSASGSYMWSVRLSKNAQLQVTLHC